MIYGVKGVLVLVVLVGPAPGGILEGFVVEEPIRRVLKAKFLVVGVMGADLLRVKAC